jgi:hypothetical protein
VECTDHRESADDNESSIDITRQRTALLRRLYLLLLYARTRLSSRTKRSSAVARGSARRARPRDLPQKSEGGKDHASLDSCLCRASLARSPPIVAVRDESTSRSVPAHIAHKTILRPLPLCHLACRRDLFSAPTTASPSPRPLHLPCPPCRPYIINRSVAELSLPLPFGCQAYPPPPSPPPDNPHPFCPATLCLPSSAVSLHRPCHPHVNL